MGFLLKKLPGAAPSCRLRDVDGVMKEIRRDGTYFKALPAGADHHIGVSEVSEKVGLEHEARCREAEEKERAAHEAYVSARDAEKAAGIVSSTESLRRDIAHLDEEISAVDEQVEGVPERRPAADRLKKTLREKQKALKLVLFERTAGKEGEPAEVLEAPEVPAPESSSEPSSSASPEDAAGEPSRRRRKG